LSTTVMASAAILQHRSSSPPTTPRDTRQSVISNHSLLTSSASSFMTAQQTQGSRNSLAPSVSSHSSANTINANATVNPLYTLSGQAQEVHVLKVTADSVQIETGPVSGSYLGTMGKSVLNTIQPNGGDGHVGPPPPSPPASVEQREDDLDESDAFQASPSHQQHPRQKETESMQPTTTILTEAPTSESPSTFLHEQTTFSTPPSSYTNRASPSREPLQRSSTEIKPTQLRPAVTLSSSLQSSAVPEASSSSNRATSHMSVDGYLQPPAMLPHARPARRNTTGSTPLSASGKRSHAHGKGASQPFGTNDDSTLGEGGLEIQTDIEIHAEKIRRERMSKRAKAQQEAEAALAGPASGSKDAPLVGNLIGEDHVNYVLMYNMLTGIRIGVCHASFFVYPADLVFNNHRCRDVKQKSRDP
jgi:1-phosphatidylinositol-4-phosphate 5-kinase